MYPVLAYWGPYYLVFGSFGKLGESMQANAKEKEMRALGADIREDFDRISRIEDRVLQNEDRISRMETPLLRIATDLVAREVFRLADKGFIKEGKSEQK